MKKATKLLLASTITLGALMGASVTTDSPVNGSAHAATSHYYTYNGYVGRDASFLLNQQFI
ncbi:immunodominant staphylococcal antigen IsaB family protein, partial [Staphylococcus epidermidis]|uniref:immunodominant staphylococcal antigen IsaB family protein n=3 Tax=Staphylococcus TaxID=1279 RepID=UPI0030BFC5EF